MITETIFNLIFDLVDMIVNILPTIPGGNLADSINSAMSFIFSNLDLFTLFIRPQTLQIIIPLFIGVHYFDEVYSLVMWVLKKIPMLGIQ